MEKKKMLYKMDPDNPKQTLTQCFRHISGEADKLEQRLAQVEKDLGLGKDQEEPFGGYNPYILREVLVPAQTLFSRAQLLIRGWEAEIRYQVKELGLPRDLRKEKIDLEYRLSAMRERWLDKTGRQILHGFRSVILEPHKKPMSPEIKGPVNQLLAAYFGDIMDDPGDWDGPAAQRLVGLLRRVGIVTGRVAATERLIAELKQGDRKAKPKQTKQKGKES